MLSLWLAGMRGFRRRAVKHDLTPALPASACSQPRELPAVVPHAELRSAQGAVVLQLFPFGWALPDGRQRREEIYVNMLDAANCSHHRWVNGRWDHAFLRK